MVKNFIADAQKPYGPHDSAVLGEFLFHNTLSVAAKLLQHVLVSAIGNSNYSNPQKQQLAGELKRVRKSKDIDVLVKEWADKHAAKGGIGVVDGKPVFGPRLPQDEEDEDDVPLAPMSYVSLGGLEAMRRVMERKK